MGTNVYREDGLSLPGGRILHAVFQWANTPAGYFYTPDWSRGRDENWDWEIKSVFRTRAGMWVLFLGTYNMGRWGVGNE